MTNYDEAAQIAALKRIFESKLREAEQAAHAFACACPVGADRTWAFEIYEDLRTVTRRH